MAERLNIVFTDGGFMGDIAHPIQFAEGEQERFLQDWRQYLEGGERLGGEYRLVPQKQTDPISISLNFTTICRINKYP